MSNSLTIATIGKSVGLWGELKLHLQTDFVEQFEPNSTWITNKNKTLTIQSYDHDRGLVKFVGISTKEDASKLTNQTLQTTVEKSREICNLGDDEYFWFDIIACKVVDDDKELGVVRDIQRLTNTDYLEIKTSKEYEKYAKTFLVPYIKGVYIDSVDIEKKIIYTKNAYSLLEIL